jgi:GNAT superfamily N-acetyltransferase
MTVLVRPTGTADHPAVIALVETLPEWFDEDARKRAIPVDLEHQSGFIASEDGEISGFITLFVAEGRLKIGWLGVRRDRRGRGIGSLLLARAEEHGRKLGLTEIATFTLGEGVDYPPYEATRRFYLDRGFTIYQRDSTDNPGCPEEIRLKKPIPGPASAGEELR